MLLTAFLGFDAHFFVPVFINLLTAILFLQSGLDKVFDYSGNRAYFQSHFASSPLSPFVTLLLPIITLLELSAGLASVIGVVMMVTKNNFIWAFSAQILSALSLTALFFGQRMAKDYGGAAGIVPYFLTVMAGLWSISAHL